MESGFSISDVTNLDFLGQYGWMFKVFVIVLATAVVRYLLRFVLERLARHVDSTRNVWDDALYDAANKPIGWAAWVVGLSWAGEVIYQEATGDTEAKAEIFGYVDVMREAAIIFLLAWFAVRFLKSFENILTDATDGDETNRWDDTTAAAVGKVLRAAVLITAFLIVLQIFGFSVAGVLAFGGIGGIAVGFAARDMLANFFGALMLFIDKPFAIGDWIRSPDKDIEGTVEDIGWRMTRIRTFNQRPLYVPNATFTNLTVENPQRMNNRRIYETFGVRYEDINSIANIVNEIREMLQTHEAIDTNRTLMVNVVSFGESAVEFFVYTFTKTTVWTEFHEIKEDVLLKIGEIIHKYGADFAFPTQTLHIADQIEPETS